MSLLLFGVGEVMERLVSKRAIGAGRPDAVHANEQAELKNLSAVQRWLDT